MNILPMAWLVGTAVTVLGLIGLTMAAKSEDLGVYLFGMLLFAFAAVFDFFLIKLGYDRAEAEGRK
jgi:hypothetical protein